MANDVAADPFVDPLAASESTIVGDEMDAVACSRGVVLRLGTEGLVVVDESYTEQSSWLCGLLPEKSIPTRSIPYFHILSADTESNGNSITIRYARPKRSTVFQVTSLSYPLEKPGAEEAQSWISRLLDRAYGAAQRNKRIKVLINPFGGKGGAQTYFTRDIEPIFAAARCDVDVEHTEHRGHAEELAEELDIEKWDVVACCSGDGIPHEVWNGFGRRSNARTALSKVAVVQLPCGSGNALSWNLNGTDSPSLAALCVVKGVRRRMDLASVTQGDKRTLSFLSQSIGIVAESDVGTDHLRWMGDFRFTYGILVRLIRKTVYPCDIALSVEVDSKDGIRKAHKAGVERPPSPPPPSERLEGHVDRAIHEAGHEGLPHLEFGTASDPTPSGLELIPHPTIGNFYAGNMPYMTADANFFPAALPSDGSLDVLRIDGHIKRRVALRMLLAVASNDLFNMEAVDYKKVKAYRLVPRYKNEKSGYISVDGERFPLAPFQVEVHRGLATVLTRGDRAAKGGYEAPGPKA